MSYLRGQGADVCALYRTRPPNAVVISLDEETGITAPRAHAIAPGSTGPTRPPGVRVRTPRHRLLVAALDVHTGQNRTERIGRDDSETFIRFLRLPDSAITPGNDIPK